MFKLLREVNAPTLGRSMRRGGGRISNMVFLEVGVSCGRREASALGSRVEGPECGVGHPG